MTIGGNCLADSHFNRRLFQPIGTLPPDHGSMPSHEEVSAEEVYRIHDPGMGVKGDSNRVERRCGRWRTTEITKKEQVELSRYQLFAWCKRTSRLPRVLASWTGIRWII